MQQALRPYATTGIAIAGAALVAVAPVAPPQPDAPWPLPQAEQRAIRLSAGPGDALSAYTDLFTNTFNNLAAMGSHAFSFPILEQLLSDPAGSMANLPNAMSMLTSLVPEISTSESGQTIVDLPPLYILALAALGPTANFNNALVDISRQILDPNSPGDPLTAILAAPATLLNAYLNGQSDFDLLGLHIPAFSGLLVPANGADINVDVDQAVNMLNLGDTTPAEILDQIGLGQKQVADVANNLLNVLGLGGQTPNDLLGQIGLADTSIASLAALLFNAMGVGNPTVTELLGRIGLADAPVADLAKNVLEALGIGNASISSLVGDTGLGDLQVADLAKNLLGGLGIGNPTVVELFDQLTGGNMTVGGVLTVALQALGLDGMSPGQLLDAMGAGNLTLVGTITGLLDALGLGNQTLPDLFGAWGVLDVSMGSVIGVVLGDAGNLSMADVLAASGLGNITTQDIVSAITMPGWGETLGDVSLGDLFRNLMNAGVLPYNDLTLNDLIVASGGTAGKGMDASMLDGLSANTINSLIQEQTTTLPDGTEIPVADATIIQLMGAQGEMTLAEFINENFGTTFGAMLDQLGFGTQTLDEIVTQMVEDSPLASLFPNVGLAALLDQMGLNEMNISALLGDTDIGQSHLFTLIDDMLGTTTVGSLVDDSDIGNTDLYTLIDQALGGTTLGSVLDDAGIGDQHLDSLFDQIFGTTTVASMLSDLGIGDVELNTLVSQLLGDLTVDGLLGDFGNQTLNELLDQFGIADLELLNLNIGNFFGSLPYLSNGLAEQFAQALGA